MNTWMNNPDFLAAAAHLFGALAIIMIAYRALGKKGGLVSTGLFIIYALIKEFWWDMNYELPKQTFGDAFLDFFSYMAGLVLALIIVKYMKDKSTSV